MSSDTWSDIQAYKNRQSSLREKLARRKKERQEQTKNLTGSSSAVSSTSQSPSSTTAAVIDVSAQSKVSLEMGATPAVESVGGSPNVQPIAAMIGSDVSRQIEMSSPPQPSVHLSQDVLNQVERHLLLMLSDITLILPLEVDSFMQYVSKQMKREIPLSSVEDLLHKFATQTLVNLESKQTEKYGKLNLIVESVDHTRLSAVTNELEGLTEENSSKKRKKDGEASDGEGPSKHTKFGNVDEKKDDIESLLSMESSKQREGKKMKDEILQLLSTPTAKEQSLIEKFKSQGGAQVKEFCPNGTKEECVRVTLSGQPCDKLHFRKIIHKHTDDSLGDCSFLNTCFHMDTCKYVHYEIDYPEHQPKVIKNEIAVKSQEGSTILFAPQWVQADLRSFDMTTLGKFSVIMADPPWDIHMELPYGTMSDDEMRKLQVPVLQDDGYIFLWVTGRAMELGRECLQLWGYERVDELIWVKTNQLQRIIRTGRTGHWLNHGKEHCLVGVKGNPTTATVNRGLDCDVIVAEVRATSHKPDEIYGIIERLSPGTRKIELFGRPHNVQPNWITLGNQVDGVKLNDPDVVKAFKARYPDGNCLKSH